VADEYGQDVLKIADEIAAYLDTHQDAADTLEGVIKWWMLRQRIEEASDKVQSAIEYLCEKGIVKEVVMAGGESIYTANHDAHRGLH
jgi:hypothetical protein